MDEETSPVRKFHGFALIEVMRLLFGATRLPSALTMSDGSARRA
jgi:hypothetical protein